ncbi:MAG: gamma-glutamyl-gamma-aminobutyrate hydrolase family protein [Olegusella sp.]|nr:gamma-glutamyl-gamma-aminobutyrate hydrolase family protein [Olegusella sp.]
MAEAYEHEHGFDNLADAAGSCSCATSCHSLHEQTAPLYSSFLEGTPSERPLICITPRWMPGRDQFCASESVGDVEMEAIIAAGGMPVMMPLTKDKGLIRAYIEMCDGFTLPGGHSVDPRRWGAVPCPHDELAPRRDALEFPLVEGVLAADKPLLAICRGAQLLDVVCGGDICQCLYDLPPREGMAHWRHAVILDRPAHPVEVISGTLLSHIMSDKKLIQTNSSHHECVKNLGRDLIVSGYATDGIIEAIEMPKKHFVLGVQWHPEYTWQTVKTDFSLWRSFVEAARMTRGGQ